MEKKMYSTLSLSELLSTLKNKPAGSLVLSYNKKNKRDLLEYAQEWVYIERVTPVVILMFLFPLWLMLSLSLSVSVIISVGLFVVNWLILEAADYKKRELKLVLKEIELIMFFVDKPICGDNIYSLRSEYKEKLGWLKCRLDQITDTSYEAGWVRLQYARRIEAREKLGHKYGLLKTE